jgi:pyridoxamine 5'-phosphate oxidase
MDLSSRQRDLEDRGLDRSDLLDDPFAEFARWFEQAATWRLEQPEAMVLATADADGRPSARHVLLKGVDHGFVFFTNYDSRKAQELDAHPVAALCFPWIRLSRQVRVSGSVERVAETESDDYFASRPRESQLGAWASQQSSVLPSRTVLEERVAEATERFRDREVPRPPSWGGYRLLPVEFEFWQGRPNRLHDRFRYLPGPDGAGTWRIDRLSP